MKKYIIIIGLIGLILPVKVLALTGSVNVKCNNDTLTLNTTTTCTLTGTSSEDVSAISARLSISGNISISNISKNSAWQGDASDGVIELYTDNNKKGTFNIVSFTIKGKSVGNGTITVSGVKFSDSSFNEHSIGGKSKTLSITTTTTTTKKTTTTTTTTKKTSTTTKNNNKSTTTTTNNKDLSSDATLKNISLSAGKINYSSDITIYNVDVSNDVESITINAEANNTKAKVEYEKELKLDIGINTTIVKVIAEDGSTKEYTLNIKRLEANLSNNSKLKSLMIDGYPINFDSSIYEYNVGNINEKELNINALPEDKNAIVEIYGKDYIGNKDTIDIKVTAEDGSSSIYTLFVNRESNNSKTNMNGYIIMGLLIISFIVNGIFIIKAIKKK